MQHLYTRSILTLSLLAFTLLAQAQPGGWAVKSSDFQFSMSMVAQIETNGVPNPALNNHVAAFSGNQIRGYAKPVQVGGQVFYFLNLYANTYLNDRLYFMAFVGNESRVYESTDTVVFLHHKQVGDLAQPYILHFTLSPRPLIYSLANINYFESTCTPGFLVDVQASDDVDTEGNGLTYSIKGGADAARFKINATTGILNWDNFTPDFEQPMDADANNIYLVDVEVADAAGNKSVQSIAVTVKDDPIPTATCPPAQTANTSDDGPGDCTTTVAGGLSVTTPSNCATYNVSYLLEGATSGQGIGQLPTNQLFFSGKTTVYYTVTDESGTLSSVCSFTVTVNDNEALTATCPSNKTADTAPGSCEALILGTELSVSDNCGTPQISYYITGATGSDGTGQIPANTLFSSGVTTVTYTAKDGGNLPGVSCTFTITVTDNELPTLTCPTNITNILSSGCSTALPGTAPTASDNCSEFTLTHMLTGASTVNGNGILPGGYKFQAGVTTVTYTATDSDGTGSLSCSFTVTVTEKSKPSITCPANKTMTVGTNCETALLDGRLTTTVQDNCTPTAALVVVQQPAAGTVISGLGTTTVQMTVTDLSGNSRTCTFNIVIEDTPELTITCPANQGLCNAGAIGDWRQLAVMTYGCSKDVPLVTQTPAASTAISMPNVPTTVTLTADDGTRLSSCTFTVAWQDTEVPTAKCKSATVVLQNGQGSLTAAAVNDQSTDNCGIQSVDIDKTDFTCANVGPNTIILTVTDQIGQMSTCSAVVTVTDPAAFCCAAPTAVCKTNPVIVLDNNGQAAISVADIDNGSTYDCGLKSATVQPNMVNCSPLGTPLTVTLSVTDVTNRTVSCQVAVAIQDNMPPVVTCPPNTTVLNTDGGGSCSITIPDYVASLMATDNCSAVTENQDIPAGSYSTGVSDGAVITVNYTATDGASPANTTTCTVAITVNDDDAPMVTCPPNTTILNTDGGSTCSIIIPNYAASLTATDNCSTVLENQDIPEGSYSEGVSDGAVITVKYTATDGATPANTTTCTVTITVNDDDAPTVTCPPNTTVIDTEGGSACSITLPNYVASLTAVDNCTPVIEAQTIPAGRYSNITDGTTLTVQYTATDGAGPANTTTCTIVITINDDDPPTVNCPSGAVTINTNGGNSCNITIPNYVASLTATDNCSVVTENQDIPAGNYSATGATVTVTYTAADGASPANIATCTIVITVNDDDPPTINCPASTMLVTAPDQCNSLPFAYTVTAMDNCALASNLLLWGLPSGSAFPVGATAVVWKATDKAGNTATCSFTVTVADTQNPSIVCPPNVVRNTDPNQCSTVVTYATPSFSDNCSGVNAVRTSGLASGSAFNKGTTMVNWKATDATGNSAICGFTVTVNDNQAPTISCPVNATKNTDPNLCSAVVTYANPLSADNCTGVITERTSGQASGMAFPKGVNTVTWKATDGAGLTKTCTFTVTVNDGQVPTITCPANQTKNTALNLCTAVVGYTNPSFTDNCAGGSVAIQSGLPAGATFPKGITTVTWKATDGAGLTKTCSFKVTVNDAQAPNINCPASQSLNTAPNLCSVVATYTTPTATDNCTPSPTLLKISGLASGSSFLKGSNVVVWRATDGAGLTKTCSFTVTVADTQSPTVNCPPSISVTAAPGLCNAIVTYPSPTATDNCAITSNILLSGLASGAQFSQGVTTNIWKATDNSGLTQTCAFTVTVSCGTSPTPSKGRENAERDVASPPLQGGWEGLLHLSPNPAVSSVTVAMEGAGAGGGTLLVFDPLGRLVLRQVVVAGQRTAELNVGDFSTGLYQVSLHTEGGTATKLLTVNRL